MALPNVVRAVTPAMALRRSDRADLSIGSTGDATVMRLQNGRFAFTNMSGQTRTGWQRLMLDSVVAGGALWHAANAQAMAAD